MQIQSKEIQMVDIDSIIPNPKNANRHSIEQIKRLEKLIKYQGFRNPLIISNRTGFLVVGHGRLDAAKNLGMDKVPVIYQDFESEAQEYAYLVSDNEIARWAELDKHAVYTELESLQLDDIELLGIEDFEIPEIEELDPQTDEDEVPEVENPITKRGDIWLLGKHRLMCGDSTMIDDVEKLMNGDKADAIYTDPPYGINLDTNYSNLSKKNGTIKRCVSDKKKILNDDKDYDPSDILDLFFYVDEIFLWGADYYAEKIYGKNDGSWIVWDKKTTEGLEKMYGSHFELCWSKNKHKREIARVTWAGCFGHDKLTDGNKKVHPTQKPVKLARWFFEKWLLDKKNIVDLFLGSGSTLICCEILDKQCYGMELDEHYCDVIINRWQNYTGKQAVLESTGESYNDLKELSNG